MRRRLVLTALIAFGLTRSAPAADEPVAPAALARVMVTAEAARLQVDTAAVGVALLGEIVEVHGQQGEWVWIAGGGRAGWVRRREVLPLDEAVEWLTGRIAAEPKSARLYDARARAWEERGEPEIALADFDEAVRLAPKSAAIRLHRGAARQRRGDHDQAVADFNEAIRLDPLAAQGYASRAGAWYFQGKYEKAIADYSEAIRRQPSPILLNNLAWLMATCPDKQFRDGPKAVADARQACELDGFRTACYVGTLAAACAETGDYETAIAWQTKALAMLAPAGQERADALARLELYRAKEPYREYDPKVQTARRPKPVNQER